MLISIIEVIITIFILSFAGGYLRSQLIVKLKIKVANLKTQVIVRTWF